MQTARTPEELNNPDYNYYLAFVIDPTERDVEKIKTTMAQRKNAFTQGTVVQRRLKELYNEAVTIMSDKPSRDEEFNNAKRFKLDTAKSSIIVIARGKGKIYKSDFKKIAESTNKWLQPDEIEREVAYLAQQGVKIIDDTKTSLDFLTYEKVEKLLKTAGKNDLYDLLGNPPTAPIATLTGTVTSVYNSVSGKADPKSTAINQICGEAKKVFKDANSKKYYDIYLATKDIWSEFALRRSTGMTDMELKEFLAYSEKAKAALKPLGINSVDDIEVLLAEGLNSYRIAVAGGGGTQIDLEPCPYCGLAYANIGNIKACPHCHQPLEVVCWNCGGQAPFTAKKSTCPTCGATKEHRERFETIIKKLDILLPSTDVLAIQTELNNLKNILPDYKKASNSRLAKKVAEYETSVKKKVEIEETTGKTYQTDYDKVQELTNLKKYMSASSAVTTLKNKYSNYNVAKTDALATKITSEIAKARQLAERAKALAAQNNEDLAVEEVAKALSLCTDYEEAKQIIAKFPPKPVRNVTATIKENAANIAWIQERQQKLATFTIIRKSGSAPTSSSDGTVVASDLTINFFEDGTIVSDTPYFYAVFTSRLGINSPIVCSPTSIITYFDVSNIRQTIIPGKISLQWDVPLNVSEVEVIKKKGLTPPTSNTDGQRLAVKNNQSFEDGDYDRSGNSYLFFCVYKNSQGAIKRSKGITRTFKAFEELKPLSNVKVEQKSATSFIMNCERISSGKLGIFYSTQEISYNFNATLQLAEFKNLYKTLKEAQLTGSNEQTANFTLPPDKTFFIYPFVANEQLVMLSKSLIVNTMIGISQIKVTEPTRDNDVILTGQPHPSAKKVIAIVSNTAFPTTMRSDGIKYDNTKESFIQEGLRLKLKANSTSYITIFTETEQESVRSTTYGVKLPEPITIQERVTIYYKMSDTISTTKPFEIKVDFKADKPTTIPPLSLVRGNPKPLDLDKGTLVDTSQPIALKKTLFSRGNYVGSYVFKSDRVAINTQFALFLSTPNREITLGQVRSL